MLALWLAGCGAGAAAGDAPEDPGTYPSEPDEALDLAASTAGWVTGDRVDVGGEGVTVRAEGVGDVAFATAPVTAVDAGRGVMVEADVTLPEPDGSLAGVWCGDAGGRNGYALLVGRFGGVEVFRAEDGETELLRRSAFEPDDVDGTFTVRLACSPAVGGRTVLGVAYDDDVDFAVLRDDDPVLFDGPRSVGVAVASGDDGAAATARFTSLTLRAGE